MVKVNKTTKRTKKSTTEVKRNLHKKMPPRRKYNMISDEDKQRIFKCYEGQGDYLLLARQLGVKRSTAYSIVERGLKNEGLVNRKRGGFRKSKVSEEMKQTLISIVEEHPEFTLNQINAEMKLLLPHAPTVSKTTVANTLNNCLIVTKQLRDAPAERNSDETKNKRLQYATWLMNSVARLSFIFVDEAGE